MTESKEAGDVHRNARVAFWVFAVALGVQSLHVLEHVVQVHQWVLYVPDPQGILGAAFNFVWVHFTFNTVLMVALVVPYVLWLKDRGIWRESGTGTWSFHALIGVQSYHTFEHVIQMWQYYVVGIQKPPGLIGELLPGILAHFDLNSVVLILMLIVFLSFQPKRVSHAIGDARASPRGHGSP